MIVIAAIPLIITNRALAAPAILKAALTEAKIKSVAIDLNVSVKNIVDSSYNKNLLYSMFLTGKIVDEIVSEFANLVKFCANEILKWSPNIIALSLFCSDNEIFCRWLCAELKERSDAVIVVGGPALSKNNSLWAKSLLQYKLIDKFFIGDSENEFVDFIKELDPNTDNNNSFYQQNTKHFYIPDYSDYNFYSYKEPSIPLIDSRGCVQNCEFCDVIELWEKFSYKTADAIFSEMLLQIEKYKIFHFDFRSSISNGNQKEFIKLMELIKEYNHNKFRSEQISWEGSFIIRTTKNSKMWNLIKYTNASLFLGVESLVESVRINLGKKFTNNDLDWHLEQIKLNNIDAKLLIIAHYPTETKEDYEYTKKWFIDHQSYAKYIREIQITRASIINETKLDRNLALHQIDIIDNNKNKWISKKTNITVDERNKYFNDLIFLVQQLGFNVYAAN